MSAQTHSASGVSWEFFSSCRIRVLSARRGSTRQAASQMMLKIPAMSERLSEPFQGLTVSGKLS